MAHTTKTILPAQWAQLNESAVTAARIQNVTKHSGAWIQATASAVTPSAENIGANGEIWIESMLGWSADRMLSELFPGVPGAAYLWAWITTGGKVSISHA